MNRLCGNVIEQAIKVTSFRKLVREECRKNGLEYPSDDKIAEYIEQGYGFDVKDFIADYKEREGIFREPITDFCKELNKYEFGDNKPTIEEIKAWTAKNGYNVSLFLRERTINSYEGFYRKTIEKALKLNENTLVNLWNFFIQESAWYGEDSHIFNLTDVDECEWMSKNLDPKDFKYIFNLVANEKVKYVQVFAKEGEPKDYIHVVDDIKGVIVAYWTEIVNRVMSFSDLYYDFDTYEENYSQRVMNNVFQPVIREMCGVPYKENNM